MTYTSTTDEDGFHSFNTIAIYSCNTGFSPVGGNNRTCTGDGSSINGTFNGVAPTCEGKFIIHVLLSNYFYIIIHSNYLSIPVKSC